jgi:hypothetical protein
MPPKKGRNRIETKGKVEGTSTGRKRDGGWSAGRHGTPQLDTSRQGKLRQGMREVVGKVFSGTSQTSPEEPKARTEPSGISEPTGGLINLRESASSPGEGTQHAQQEEWGLKRRQEKSAVRESKKAKIEISGISGPTGGLVDFGESTSAQPERGLKRRRREPAGIAQASSEAQKEQIQKEIAEEDISPARKRIKLEPLAKNITPDSTTGSSKSKKPNFEPTQEDYGLLADITEHEINTAIRKLTDHTKKEDKKATNNPDMLKMAGRYIEGRIRARNGLKSKPKENMIDILKKGDKTIIASGLILKEILRSKKEKEWTVREGPKTLEEACTAISEVITDMLDITGNDTDTIEDNLAILNTQDRRIKGIISSIKVAFAPDFATGRLPGEKAESSESKEPNFEPTQEDYGLLADITEHEINIAIRKLTDHTEKDEKATNSKYRLEKAGRYINGQDLRKCLQSNPEKTMIDILKEGDPTRIASGLILKEILRAKKEEEWHKKGEEWHKKNFISTVREGCKTFGEVRTAISKVCTDMLAITGNNTDTIEDNLKTLNTQDGQIEGIISSIYEAYKGLKWAKGPQFPGNSTPKLSGQDLADQTPAPKGPLDKETIPFERLMAVARKSGL